MARPRLPTKVLELRGAFKKNPQRRREREGEPEPEAGLGKPPKELDAPERARWKELGEIAPWLTVADRAIAEMTVKLWVLERKNALDVGKMKLLASNYAQLGLTPTGRSRVKVPAAKPKSNPFSGLRRRA